MNDIQSQRSSFKVIVFGLEPEDPMFGIIGEILVRHSKMVVDIVAWHEGGEEADTADLVILKLNAVQSLSGELSILSSFTQWRNPPYVTALFKRTASDLPLKLYELGVNSCIGIPITAGRMESELAADIAYASDSGKELEMDVHRLQLKSKCAEVALSYFEMALLLRMNQSKGRLMRRAEIANLLMDGSIAYDERAMEKFISRLRLKIKSKLGVDLIVSLRGIGYRLALGLLTDMQEVNF